MTRRGSARGALGLMTIAALIMLLAPPAVASPESDAADAINAAWEQAGGDSSVLGAKQGDVYPVGDGFAQNFDGGKMFFTPGTGAKALYGAVLDKYQSMGGPAGSTLGFPTINEVPGLSGPDSRVATFSAGDNPVIFWTPAHGAYVVRGAMNAAWDKLGSSAGVLGVPVGDETYDGEDATQSFTGGKVSWNRVTKIFSTVPPDLAQQLTGLQVIVDPAAAIDTAWRAAGGASGPLGAKQGEPYAIGNDAGLAQNFAGGKIFFSNATGADAVESAILAKYESIGGPVGSDLGFPIANEADGGIAGQSRISTFSAADNPVIFWTPEHGAFVVRGAMKAAWDKLGGAKGRLGAPTEDQTVYGDLVSQKFTGGKITWNRVKNTFSTEPPKLASALSGLRIPGQNLPASSGQPASGNGPAGHWWWLLGVIPVLLVIGLLALMARRRRGRTASPDDVGPADSGREVPAEHAAGSDAEPEWSAGDVEDIGWLPAAAAGSESLADETGDSEPECGEDLGAEDPDAVDTAPTRVPSEAEMRGGRHAALDAGAESEAPEPAMPEPAVPEPTSPEPAVPAYPTIHLPLDDPHQAPDGYPVKGNASFALYYTPDSHLYDDAFAEIWFASEEIARANGFTKGE